MDKNILKLYLEFCEFKRSMTPYCEVHQQFPPFHFYNGTLNLSFPAYKLRKIASWLEAVPIVTDLIRTSWILMVWINNEKFGYFDLTWVTYIVGPLLFMYLVQCHTWIFAPKFFQIDNSILIVVLENICNLGPVFLVIQGLEEHLVRGFSNVLLWLHCVVQQNTWEVLYTSHTANISVVKITLFSCVRVSTVISL